MSNLSLDTVSISIKNLKKQWSTLRGTVTALSKVDLQIEQGEFFVLLGPSGCGKSTLLNLLAGLDTATHGEIIYGDKSVVNVEKSINLEPKERNIAMVFQSYALYPHFTVRQNIAFPLTNIKNMPKDQINTRVEEVVKMLKITDLLDRKPSELSGGQRQRVAIGRALVRKPQIFLMDEPLSNLDALLRNEMRVQIKALQKRLGITTIYVTHDQLEAMTLADKIALLHGGIVQQIGSPEHIYNKPSNIFVAKFLGSPPMNILQVEISTDGFYVDNTKIVCPLPQETQFIGIRPEHIIIHEKDVPNTIPVTIEVIENIGTEFLIHTHIMNQAFVIKTINKPSIDKVYLELPNTYLHSFNIDQGRIEI